MREKGNKQNQSINNTLVRLQFNHACIDPASLSGLALKLPCLKELHIENCAFVNSTIEDINKPAKIHMPNTSLDKLTLHWSGEYSNTWSNQYSKLPLKVFTTTGNNSNSRKKKFKYYGLDGLEMKTISAKEYKEGLKVDSKDCLSFYIECRDITTIRIKFNDLPRQISLNLKE